MEAQRYKLSDHGGIKADDQGLYVLHEDYAEILDQLAYQKERRDSWMDKTIIATEELSAMTLQRNALMLAVEAWIKQLGTNNPQEIATALELSRHAIAMTRDNSASRFNEPEPQKPKG